MGGAAAGRRLYARELERRWERETRANQRPVEQGWRIQRAGLVV